jgi:hypothetical protein
VPCPDLGAAAGANASSKRDDDAGLLLIDAGIVGRVAPIATWRHAARDTLMAHRRSFLSAVTTLGIALGMSVVLAGCASTTSSQPAASGAVAGATAEASAEASASSSPEASSSSGASLSVQGAAETATCSALQAWSDEMQAFVALDPAVATTNDAKAQVQKIRVAWDNVKTSLDAVEAADEAAVRDAGKTLEAALDDFQTDVPIADATAKVKTAAEPLRTAYKDMADGMGCNLTNPY